MPGEIWHASAVEVRGRAIVVTGRSGRGKSTLCLALMGLGATLVGDDRVRLRSVAGVLTVSAIDDLSGKIEARGLGILAVPFTSSAEVAWVLDLDLEPAQRLPEAEFRDVLGQNVPLLRPLEHPHAASALYQLLMYERLAP
ncbi:MAG: serine kinase [Rhodobacteraceae bacterium]|nr:serine kinase [Paracoccaceae bacterium]